MRPAGGLPASSGSVWPERARVLVLVLVAVPVAVVRLALLLLFSRRWGRFYLLLLRRHLGRGSGAEEAGADARGRGRDVVVGGGESTGAVAVAAAGGLQADLPLHEAGRHRERGRLVVLEVRHHCVAHGAEGNRRAE